MRRAVRLVAVALTSAAMASSGFAVGPRPEPVRAPLVAVGVDDTPTMKHDRTAVVAAPGVLANDTDADGDALVAALVGSVSGSLSLDPNGGFRYTPPGGFSGTTTFSYRVWDGVTWSLSTTVALMLLAPLPTPVPTPSPSPTPTATPSPTPTPLPIPSLPIPSLPIPSLPIPSIPLPTPSLP